MRSQLIDEPVWIVQVLSVVCCLGPDKEVMVIKDFIQGQSSVKVVVTSGKQMVNFILNKIN